MRILRRTIVCGAAAALFLNTAALGAETPSSLYGLIGKMTTQPGKRDSLARILNDGVAGMPGCLSYVIANDPVNSDLLWITEVWTNKQAHDASLSLPSVRDAITKGRPLISGMETVAETHPVGGSGLTGR
jgi:quinol monooxygenase YgiN